MIVNQGFDVDTRQSYCNAVVDGRAVHAVSRPDDDRHILSFITADETLWRTVASDKPADALSSDELLLLLSKTQLPEGNTEWS